MPKIMQQDGQWLNSHVLNKNAEKQGAGQLSIGLLSSQPCAKCKKWGLCAVRHKAQQPVGLPKMQHIEEQDCPHRFVAIIARILFMMET